MPLVLLAAAASALLVTISTGSNKSQASGHGLIAHWQFDDGTATDITGNGNDGTVNGASPFAGKIGAGALEFDGNNDFVDAGNIDVPGEAITVAAWINADNLRNCSASDCRIVSKATGTGEQDHYIMLSTIKIGGGVKLRFRLKAGGTTTLLAPLGNLSNGQWYHAAAVYDGAFMRLYLNGAAVAITAKSGAIDVNPAVPLWIGGNPPTPTSRPWEGKIDDVRLYDIPLSPAEISELAQVQSPTPSGPFETLAPTEVESGSGFVAAGTGLLSQPGIIDIEIPASATIKQVFLYWEGQLRGGELGDSEVTVDGIPVTGVSIGGPTRFFGDVDSQTFRADITSLQLLAPGMNSVAIAGLNNSFANNGAGILPGHGRERWRDHTDRHRGGTQSCQRPGGSD